MLTIKPKTRKEIYLAYLAGDMSLELPEPLTRDEVNLYNLCKNRAYGEYTTVKEVLAECQPEFSEDDDAFVIAENAPVATIGETYTVNWNGKEYICEAVEFEAGSVVIGDYYTFSGGALGDKSTGEPFALLFMEGVCLAFPLDGSTTLTISIRQEVTEVKKIDAKYLPDSIGGVTSWNDLEDKPFGETTTVKEVLAECQPTYDEDTGFYAGACSITAGETYTVNWNGVDYVCVAQDLSAMLDGMVGLGNLADMGGAGNGEPFFGMCMGGELSFEALDGSTTLTISIRQEVTTVTTLPVEYMHPSVPYVEEGGFVEILPETTLDLTAEVQPYKLGLVTGETYTVKWDGAEYECVAQEFDEDGTAIVCLGDLYTVSQGSIGTAATGEPFALMEYPPALAAQQGLPGAFVFMPFAEPTDLTLAIYQVGVTIHKLDNRCLDLAWLPTMNEEKTVLFAKENCEFSGSIGVGNHSVSSYQGSEALPLVDGEDYTVVWDGVKYSRTCTSVVESDINICYLGNQAFDSSSLADTGEPFLFKALSANGNYMLQIFVERAGTDVQTHTFEVSEITAEISKMPKEFMPEDATEMFLVSPNGTKYSVTVSDAGALTATAVT